MKQIQNREKKSYGQKLLVTGIAAVCTSMIATSITRASDIDIYQEAKSGTITLMFMIDISGSMTNEHETTDTARAACELSSSMTAKNLVQAVISGGPSYRRQWCEQSSKWVADDRITRVKDGMMDLLHGNPGKGIARLSDDKVIGLSTLGANDGKRITLNQRSGYYDTGSVLVPARRLDTDVQIDSTTTKKHREILIDAVKKLEPKGATPTARSYAETIAYMMGKNTQSSSGDNRIYYFESTRSGTTYYRECTEWSSNQCTKFSAENTTNPMEVPEEYTLENCTYYIRTSDNKARTSSSSGYTKYDGKCFKGWATTDITGSGFKYSAKETKVDASGRYRAPASLTQEDDIKKCSGQGIYILTDGAASNDSSSRALMRNAIDNSAFNCGATTADGTYACVQAMATTLLDPNKNPMKLKFKTAIVGFGKDFNNVPSYKADESQEENLKPFLQKNPNGTLKRDTNGNVIKRTDLTSVEESAYWGIIGEGGWYSGSNSEDIVKSVNHFIDNLGTGIPSVTTGSPTIPKDALNPVVLQDDAYYQQFQPTPDKNYSLWLGNLKKYTVGSSGKLKGKDSQDVHDSRGRLILPTYDTSGKLTSAVYDFWSYGIDTNTTIADADENTIGSKKFAAKGGMWSQLQLRTEDNVLQRKLLTNRVGTGTGTAATFTSSNSTLRTVNLDYLTDPTYQDDPDRGYLMSLLGYRVDATHPDAITTTSLASAPELRQVGAIMHSLPVLVTNKGKVSYNTTTKKIGSTNREDYVLFGTTQGLLHVVDAKTGQEKFAFVPNEMVDNQYKGFTDYTLTSGGVNHLYYGIDGPWTVHTEYVIDSSGNLTVGSGKGTNQKGKQLAFGGLRMGGRSYYSLDLQNIDAPKLNFHINPTGTCSNSNPLGCMGESWSKPSVAYVNWGGKRTLVMFVGGGYDRGYETDTYDQTDSKKGAGIFMFRAENETGTGTGKAGDLLWWANANATTSDTSTNSGTIGLKDANLKYSVVSEIRTVDRDGDDLVDHLYFGDLGGQVFRVDLNNKATTLGVFGKRVQRILDLNTETSSGKRPRFYDMPSFSIYNEKGKTFAVISIGSGNRSQPLQDYTVGTTGVRYDAIYNLYDKDVARKELYTTSSLNTKNIKDLVLLTEDNRYSDTTPVAQYSTNGWYYQFNNCVAGSDGTKKGCNDYKLQSEKVFGTPLAMNYRLYVSTFDSSKPGISGDCGAGVKGESFLTTFCLPYGQCKSGGSRGKPIGIGIQNITTGNDNKCEGDECNDGDDGDDGDDGNGSTDDEDKVASSSNYCANTGGRILVTTTGAGGVGQATQMCLIPQRWYEKNSLIR